MLEGTEKIEVDGEGDLLLQITGSKIKMNKPFVYQVVDGLKKEIAGSYVLNPKSETRSELSRSIENPKSTTVSFQVASYDVSRPLIIDPTISYSTFVGGSGADFGLALYIDSDGNAYIGGCTCNPTFTTTRKASLRN